MMVAHAKFSEITLNSYRKKSYRVRFSAFTAYNTMPSVCHPDTSNIKNRVPLHKSSTTFFNLDPPTSLTRSQRMAQNTMNIILKRVYDALTHNESIITCIDIRQFTEVWHSVRRQNVKAQPLKKIPKPQGLKC